MYMCIFVHISIRASIYIYRHMCLHGHARICVRVYLCSMYMCVYVCMCGRIYVFVFMFVYLCVFVFVCVPVCMCMHVCVYVLCVYS